MRKKLDYLCNCKSEISNVCNALSSSHENRASPCNGRFDWLISRHQSVNPSRESISILSGKYERFTFVHPVLILLEYLLVKVTGIRPMAPVLNKGPLEGI